MTVAVSSVENSVVMTVSQCCQVKNGVTVTVSLCCQVKNGVTVCPVLPVEEWCDSLLCHCVAR